ncbi:App1 family protein [uncultured Psychroserpens sp.]|uniref:App1 family protein n=1 Tax=uncultured Psychroserpens sp. TaxID=255436 RepID=UPI002610229B|nr:phosphatase domain-containing protein [uncultured Psychroserpens sp.]
MNWFKKDPLQIITFQSYGTDTHFYMRGRALEDETINLEQKGLFGLFINSWKRFETDEIKNTTLKIKLPNGIILKTVTDDHGYFKIDEQVNDLHSLANAEGWLNMEVSYDDANISRSIQKSNRFPGELLIPSKKADYGVISDIDDTIIHTGVASTLKWKVLFNSIFKSAASRIPLEGAAEFYHKLHRGVSGANANPIFYVSHSPWNLYRYLEFFLKQNDFPKGPILLRSFKDIFKKKSGDQPQKQIEIINILKAYPDLKFILIGDSGEYDADIYIELAKTFPDQVMAIYLRSVKHKKKMLRVRSLFNQYDQTPVLLVESSAQAIEHARANGFINKFV